MDNQSGVTFKNMFGDYLKGATEITVVDPYIRLPYQLRNFKEFCSLIVETREVGLETSINLITNNNEDYIMNAKESFQMIQDSLAAADVQFSYEFSETAHDRSIVLNNGWKIILGRGLDIWQKTAGRDDIAEMNQAMRSCKEFEMTIIANGNK
jgi:ATP-dependent Lon protease